MECHSTINQILKRMDDEFDSYKELVDSWNQTQSMLFKLSDECSNAFTKVFRELLNSVSDNDRGIEDKLWIIILVIVAREHPEAFDLTAEALVNKKTRRKDDYVDIIDRFEDKRAIAPLMHAFELDYTELESVPGWTRFKIIDALCRIQAKEATVMIIPCVKDSADRVRNSAIEFLIYMDVPEAATVFMEQLCVEDDEQNLEKLIRGLVLWRKIDSLPLLRNLLSQEWIKSNEDIVSDIVNAIASLEAMEVKGGGK